MLFIFVLVLFSSVTTFLLGAFYFVCLFCFVLCCFLLLFLSCLRVVAEGILLVFLHANNTKRLGVLRNYLRSMFHDLFPSLFSLFQYFRIFISLFCSQGLYGYSMNRQIFVIRVCKFYAYINCFLLSAPLNYHMSQMI